MKPDSYMPFYWADFFKDVDNKSDQFIVAYQRALWSYWSNNHCEGLENKDEELKRICRVDKDEWPELKRQIFDNNKFFKMTNGKWHQKRAQKEWKKSCEKYEEQVKRINAINKNRTK